MPHSINPETTHFRGYLPHIEGANFQMITFRLADSLPQNYFIKIKNETKNKAKQRQRIEDAMDRGYGRCWLAEPEIATLVANAFKKFHQDRYNLIAFTVMPNHVHVLIEVFEGETLYKIVHSWKSYTAHAISRYAKSRSETLTFPIWQREYWDRHIRDQRHYEAAIRYIEDNPVKAGLVVKAED
ncbi:MAG: transposase [Oleibacter sp.]|nr:transposase [Thalassolituus sp.]